MAENQNQIEHLRAHLTKSEAKNHDLEQRNDQLSTEMRDCLIERKSLDLKLKNLEERSEREQKASAIQVAARLEQLQKDCDARVRDYASENLDLICRFVELAKSEFQLSFLSNSLQSFIESLRRYLSESKDRESVYEETIVDLTRSRQLLGLSASDEICPIIEKLIADKNKLHEKQRDLEAALQEKRAEGSRAARALARLEDDIGALRQWELWARRLHRIVYESACSTYSSDQLRLALEDTLLAAVSHRSLLNRLNSLREQKKHS